MGADSGESEIRRWILENDWLEAVVALPEQMFYNTGIGTYVWSVADRKVAVHRRRVHLLDAHHLWTVGGSPESRRSLGDKRCRRSAGQIDEIVRPCGRFKAGCEINFNRHFYACTSPRPLEESDADLKRAEEKIVRLLREVVG